MNNAMTEISGFLAEAPMCFIATVSGNEPHVRAFQYQFEQDGKLWFCTAKSKNVFKQLQGNPAVEICAVNKDMAWVRVTARVSLDDNRAVKERVGGTEGCTHLREVLAQMATVAYQTLYPVRREKEQAAAAASGGREKPRLIGTCLAYAPDSPVVKARWPWLAADAAAE